MPERLERSQLEVLDLQHNSLMELPYNLFIKAQRCTFISFVLVFMLLCLHLLFFLSATFFHHFPHWSVVFPYSLRYLNVSANRLENLPAASLSEDGSSRLEELYVTNNSLSDKCIPLLMGHGLLRVLHVAFNRLQTFTAR